MPPETDQTTATAAPRRSRYEHLRAELAEFDGIDRVARAIELAGGEADSYRLVVMRQAEGEARPASVWSGPVALFDEARLVKAAGAGRFLLQLRDRLGVIVTTAALSIDPAAVELYKPESPGPSGSDLAAEVRELRGMIEALASRAPTESRSSAPPWSALLGAMPAVAELIKALRGEGLRTRDIIELASQRGQISDLVAAMRDLQALSPGGGAEGGSGGGEWTPVIAELMAMLRATRSSQPLPPPRAPAPIPRAIPPAPTATAQPAAVPERPPAPPPPATPLDALTLNPYALAIGFGSSQGLSPESIAPAVADLLERDESAPELPCSASDLEAFLRSTEIDPTPYLTSVCEAVCALYADQETPNEQGQ
ncbi:MAG: hypothetical protein DYG93_11150 [Leptolyngbya sp. PLA2]|nr:hypothetical protein [Leptolyngbya sp.]MCE7972200.1 hypothetical protein [Leptolyngbya sp. PL-A2]MCQ3941222.1 hypothetical protein [cyanobacterium CYA1]MDL1905507.1 hypothetical protein [Synechococcales cyanobacterium CNB]